MKNPKTKMEKGDQGFTFIELLIVMAVLSIAILPLMNMYSTALYQSGYTSDLTTARYLAQEGMEKIKNSNYTVEQLRQMSDIWEPPLNSPPLEIDGRQWRTARKLVLTTQPLEIHIQVFKNSELTDGDKTPKPLVELVTLFEDFDWML